MKKLFKKKKQVELGMPKKGWKQVAEVRHNALLYVVRDRLVFSIMGQGGREVIIHYPTSVYNM